MTFNKPLPVVMGGPMPLGEYRKLSPLNRRYEGIIGWKERTYTDWRLQMIRFLPLMRSEQTEIIVLLFLGELER